MVATIAGPDVCVIEDDAPIAMLLDDLLRLEGYRVVTFPDGRALERVLADPPRLLLLDLMLPGLDGAQICNLLRADPRARAMPIVIMTAAAPMLSEQRLAGCDYQALLRKPFDLETILGIVARYVREQPPGRTDDDAAIEGGRAAL